MHMAAAAHVMLSLHQQAASELHAPGCRVWGICIADESPTDMQNLGFQWFTHVVMAWPLPHSLILSLLTGKMMLLLPRLHLPGWHCFLAFFRQVWPCLWLAADDAWLSCDGPSCCHVLEC